jgi:hypothetical protein
MSKYKVNIKDGTYQAIQNGRNLDILIEWYKEFGYGYYYYIQLDEEDRIHGHDNVNLNVIVSNKNLSIMK